MASRKRGIDNEQDQSTTIKRTSLDFSQYHYIRPTNIFFECSRCTFKAELRNWLYHESTQKWCLHLDKFHRCGPEKTRRCSQQILPPYSKSWPTMNNDTAKRLLQAGLLANLTEALGSSKQTSYGDLDSFDDLFDQLDFSPFEFDSDEAVLLEKDAASM